LANGIGGGVQAEHGVLRAREGVQVPLVCGPDGVAGITSKLCTFDGLHHARDSGRANVNRRHVGAQQRARGALEDGGAGAVEAEKIRKKAKCG
jgi:hypothetical protein